MEFDFNDSPERIYGIWPNTPFPVEVSIYGTCSSQCAYCFANLGRKAAGRKPHVKNPIEGLINRLEKARANEYSPIGFFLREKYPICFSNTTDPFMKEEKMFRCSEAFMKYCRKIDVPLFIQTKGRTLWDEKERYVPMLRVGKDVVYITLTSLDDDITRRIEPGAPVASERLKLIEYLSERNIPVIVAANPFVHQWIPDKKEYCRIIRDAGARGVWMAHLHFNEAQKENVAESYKDIIKLTDIQFTMYGFHIKDWYRAAEPYGLDVYTGPQWSQYFGHREKFPEAADPAWLGGKTFDYMFRISRFISALCFGGREVYKIKGEKMTNIRTDKKVFYSWGSIERLLKRFGCPNPTLDVSPFWYPYNARINADSAEFRGSLGKRNTLYNILRYFFNHPWENEAFYGARLIQLFGETDEKGVAEALYLPESNDVCYVFNPDNRYPALNGFSEDDAIKAQSEDNLIELDWIDPEVLEPYIELYS